MKYKNINKINKKIGKLSVFLAAVFVFFMFLASVSFGENNAHKRGLDSAFLREGVGDSQKGSIYNLNEYLNEFIDKEDYSLKNSVQIKNVKTQKSINLKNEEGVETFVNDYVGIDESLEIIGRDKSEKNKLEFTYYQQTYNNIPVYNGYFDVVMKNGKIVKINYNLYDTSDVIFDKEISEEDSIELVLNDIEEDGSKEAAVSIERIKSKIDRGMSPFIPNEMIFENRLVWRIIIPNFVYFIDASSGEIISKESTIRYDVYGTVYGSYYAHDPSQEHLNATFEDNYVFLDNETNEINGTTNETGFYNISIDGSPLILTSYLWGPYVNVYNLVQNYSMRNISIIAGENSWNWSDNDTSDRQEESNVFYHVNLIHDYFQRGGTFNLTHIDYSIEAYVQLDECNAYYSGSEGIGELDFGNGGGVSGCENLALGSEIIYHEYTHMVTDGIYGSTSFPYAMQTGAMNEAWSDYYACTITNDPAQGDSILPAGYVRYLNNSLIYPDDWNWEVHDDSRMISAAMWALRTSIGNETADALIFDSMKMKPQSFTDVLNDILVADDDNANLDDGTPNSSYICSAFEGHGIISDYCYGYSGLGHSEYSNSTTISIPDNGTYVNSSIIVSEEDGESIQDLEVYVNITHGRVSDLAINLVSPNGTSVKLYGGSSCGWGTGTSLTKWFDQEYPVDGHDCYSPAEMEFFNNMRTNGTWYLNVTDYVNTEEKLGQINSFELKFYYNVSVNVSQGNPVDYYNDTDGNITFDFKCLSINSISMIQLWTNSTGTWHANYSNDSYTNDTWLNITQNNISDGIYVWSVYCNDTFGNSDRTDNRSFTVDVLTPPSIILNSPSGYSNLTSIEFNCSATDSGGLKNISLWTNSTGIWHENETENVSGNSNSSIFNKNLSADNFYIWNCYVCDLQNNCNFSENQTFVIDDSAPTLILNEPEDGYVFAAGTTLITFQWSVTDNLDSNIGCSVYTKNSYQDEVYCTNATACEQDISGFSAGSYNWRVNCSDGINQGISELRDFSINSPVPSSGGGGGGYTPQTNNESNQTNESEEETSGSSFIIKTLGDIVTPTGIAGMPISGIGVGDEINFKIIDQVHFIKIKEILDNSVLIEIRSDPIIIRLDLGESKEFDLNGDGKNDFKITLNSIFNGKATLTLFSLPSEEAGAGVAGEKSSSGWSWVIYLVIGVVLVVVFILITFFKKKNKSIKRRRKRK